MFLLGGVAQMGDPAAGPALALSDDEPREKKIVKDKVEKSEPKAEGKEKVDKTADDIRKLKGDVERKELHVVALKAKVTRLEEDASTARAQAQKSEEVCLCLHVSFAWCHCPVTVCPGGYPVYVLSVGREKVVAGQRA